VYRWKLWYEDGSTFSSDQGEPNDSPVSGLLAVGQPGVDYKDVVWNENFYIYRRDHGYWSGHDVFGLVDQVTHFAPVIGCVRAGRDTANSTMKGVARAATIEVRGG
jgi:hypothetical protein